MPNFDGAGPSGQGSMTGRGQGYCMSVVPPENTVSGFGYGVGRGGRPHGCGLGRCSGGKWSAGGRRNCGSGRRFGGRGQTSRPGDSAGITGT